MTEEYSNHHFDKDDVFKTNSLPPEIFRQQVLSEGQSSVYTNSSSDADSGFQQSGGPRQFSGVKLETVSFSESDDFILNEGLRTESIFDEEIFGSREEALSSVGESEPPLGDYSGLKKKWLKSVDAATLNIIQVLLYSKFHLCMFLFSKYLGF